MKRAIAMTLVLFLLSLGGFTAVTAWMCRTQEQVEFTNIVARGDESVARGLHMTEYDLLHNRVLWTTEHDLGTESRVTKTTCGQKTDYQYNSIGASAPYTICRLLPETPELMAYLRQHIQNPADEVTINLADFAQSYDLCLSYGGSGTMLTAQDVKENGDYRDFPDSCLTGDRLAQPPDQRPRHHHRTHQSRRYTHGLQELVIEFMGFRIQ